MINWRTLEERPCLGQYVLMEDHEGNWTVGVFAGNLVKFPYLPSTGFICSWSPLKIDEQGIVYHENGELLTYDELYTDLDEALI